MILKREKVRIEYRIVLSEGTKEKIMIRDRSNGKEKRLYKELRKITGVIGVSYPQHGEVIFISLDGTFDNEKTWSEIELIISYWII